MTKYKMSTKTTRTLILIFGNVSLMCLLASMWIKTYEIVAIIGVVGSLLIIGLLIAHIASQTQSEEGEE